MERTYKHEVSTLLGTLNTLLNELENNVTIPSSAELGMKYAIGMILDDVHTFLKQDYSNAYQTEIENQRQEQAGEWNDLADFEETSFQEMFMININDTHKDLIYKYVAINKDLDNKYND